MKKLIYERYSSGISSNNIVNNISNDSIFQQYSLKKEHLIHQELWCSFYK